MSLQLDERLVSLGARLGWTVRETGRDDETCFGDYANGYLLLVRERYIQLARRSPKGDPSLKLWSPNVHVLQRYLAFSTAQLVRVVEGSGAPVSLATDPSALPAPFRLVHDESRNVFLQWQADGLEQWAGFGRGNEFLAVQFAQYVLTPLDEIIDGILSPDAADRFRAPVAS